MTVEQNITITGQATSSYTVSSILGGFITRHDANYFVHAQLINVSNMVGVAITNRTTSGFTVEFTAALQSSDVVQFRVYDPFGGEITATLLANQHDWAPSGIATCSVIRTSGPSNLTGITGGVAGRRLTIYNNSVNPIVLKNLQTSLLANQIFTYGLVDASLGPMGAVTLWYDGVDSRWRMESINQP